jgi:hypothetical protein
LPAACGDGQGGGGSGSEPAGPDSGGAAPQSAQDRAMLAAVGKIIQGIWAFRAANGYVPDATLVQEGGAVAGYIDGGWPENPYSGGPIRNVWASSNESMPDRGKPGDIIYWTGTGTSPHIRYVLSDRKVYMYTWSWQ